MFCICWFSWWLSQAEARSASERSRVVSKTTFCSVATKPGTDCSDNEISTNTEKNRWLLIETVWILMTKLISELLPQLLEQNITCKVSITVWNRGRSAIINVNMYYVIWWGVIESVDTIIFRLGQVPAEINYNHKQYFCVEYMNVIYFAGSCSWCLQFT